MILTQDCLGKDEQFNNACIAIALTIFNLFFPNLEPHNFATIANRLITAMALAVTGWLSIRNRYSEEAVARSQAQLRTQQQLAILFYVKILFLP